MNATLNRHSFKAIYSLKAILSYFLLASRQSTTQSLVVLIFALAGATSAQDLDLSSATAPNSDVLDSLSNSGFIVTPGPAGPPQMPPSITVDTSNPETPAYLDGFSAMICVVDLPDGKNGLTQFKYDASTGKIQSIKIYLSSDKFGKSIGDLTSELEADLFATILHELYHTVLIDFYFGDSMEGQLKYCILHPGPNCGTEYTNCLDCHTKTDKGKGNSCIEAQVYAQTFMGLCQAICTLKCLTPVPQGKINRLRRKAKRQAKQYKVRKKLCDEAEGPKGCNCTLPKPDSAAPSPPIDGNCPPCPPCGN